MHPILSDFRRFLWYVAIWLLAGALFSRLLVSAGLCQWIYALTFALPVSLIFGFVATSSYYICRTLPLSRRSIFLTFLMFGSSAMVSGILLLGICEIWNMALVSVTGQEVVLAISNQLAAIILATGFALYLLALLAYDVLISFDNLRAAERREAASRLFARDAELQLLRTQIDPHFLFNSLNSISALTSIDPAGARNMAISLADFFRKTLALSEHTTITVREELDLCGHFLAVEKIRYGQKLQVNIQVDHTDLALIPPMSLQPLFENAIKHGVRQLPKGGLISASICGQDGWLHIRVENPVSDKVISDNGIGLGLTNLRERFNTIYGDRARVHWSRTENLFFVEISLPIELKRQADTI